MPIPRVEDAFSRMNTTVVGQSALLPKVCIKEEPRDLEYFYFFKPNLIKLIVFEKPICPGQAWQLGPGYRRDQNGRRLSMNCAVPRPPTFTSISGVPPRWCRNQSTQSNIRNRQDGDVIEWISIFNVSFITSSCYIGPHSITPPIIFPTILRVFGF